MSARVKLTATLVVDQAASIDLSDTSGGSVFDDVRVRAEGLLATSGVLGAAWQELDAPAKVSQFSLRSIDGSEVAARVNAAPATVLGSGASFGTIANGETLQVNVDQGGTVTVTFLTGDTTLAAVVARINAALGAIVASSNGGQLQLTGAKTGGADAVARSWQYGTVQVVGGTALAKLGLSTGTTYGAGRDVSTTGRIFMEFPGLSSPLAVTSIHLSGSGRIRTHIAGSN